MRNLVLAVAIVIAGGVCAKGQTMQIGEIEFFGYSGIDLDKVRLALPFREGDRFNPESDEQKYQQVRDAVVKATGHPPTDIAPTCCDGKGQLIVFIGLSGKSPNYNPKPTGAARLPKAATSLYDRLMEAWMKAVVKGAANRHRILEKAHWQW